MSTPLENAVEDTLNHSAISVREKPKKTESYELNQLLKELAKAQAELAIARNKRTESDDLSDLFCALAKAQMEILPAKNNCTNSFLKSNYADLKSIVEASRIPLASRGLCVIQRIIDAKGARILKSRLGHHSGQWIESVVIINPPKADIHTLGSYITYLRRYSYASLVGVVAGGEDDDGEGVMMHERNKGKGPSNISKEQLDILASELKGYPDLVESILKGYSISKLSDLPSAKYSSCLEGIRHKKISLEKNGGR